MKLEHSKKKKCVQSTMVKSQENKWEREELLWGRHRAE